MARSFESWSLNGAHIHGTDVPVKEPSTASKTEVAISLDRLVAEHEKRRCAAERRSW
jgi:hypothetical protein